MSRALDPRASKRLLRALFENALDAIVLADDQGRYVEANPAACALFGLAREALLGRRIMEFAAPDFAPPSDWETFIAGGSAHGEFPLRRADGARRLLDYRAVANILPGLHVSYLRDITERRHTEQALRRAEEQLRTASSTLPVEATETSAHEVSSNLAVITELEIEARPRADSALRASEARFRRIIEQSEEALWLLDAEGVVTYANAGLERLLGADTGGVIGSQALAWIAADDQQLFTDELARFNVDTRGGVVEFRLRADATRWIEIKCSNMLDDPAVGALVCSLRDVSERKLAEQALRDSKRRLEEAQALAEFGSWSSGQSWSEPANLSPEWYRLFGIEAGAPLTLEQMHELVHPDDRPRVRRTVLAATHDFELEYRVECRDGTVRRMHERARMTLDASGKRIGLRGVVQDVTDRRRAESELRASEQRYRGLAETMSPLAAIVESAGDAIIATDLAGTISAANHSAVRLYGYSASELIGNSVSALLPAESAEQELDSWIALARAGSVAQSECTRKRKDGSLVEVSQTLSPIRDTQGKIVGVSQIARDLTERRQADALLRRSAERLQQAQNMEAMARLAGGVAGDFNNLSSVLAGCTFLMLADLKSGDPLREELVQIDAAARRGGRFTKQLLALSGQQILEPQAVDLNATVIGLERTLQKIVGDQIELVLDTSVSVGPVYADPAQIEQVIINLALNARAAMPQAGQLTIETSERVLGTGSPVEEAGLTPGQYVMLAVSDTGIGMDAETAARVFEPFFTTKLQDAATGLGLSTVLGIVKQSGGHISVSSELGAGTKFELLLPRSERPAGASSPPDSAAVTWRGSETILLVEGDEALRVTVRTILRRQGYLVLEASNAGEALLICEQHRATIHLLLSDSIMARMNGRQLAERLTSLRPDMRVLFMSGDAHDVVARHRVLDSGIAYLAKPLRVDVLARKLREVLDSR